MEFTLPGDTVVKFSEMHGKNSAAAKPMYRRFRPKIRADSVFEFVVPHGHKADTNFPQITSFAFLNGTPRYLFDEPHYTSRV
jgi:hypothetical protein